MSGDAKSTDEEKQSAATEASFNGDTRDLPQKNSTNTSEDMPPLESFAHTSNAVDPVQGRLGYQDPNEKLVSSQIYNTNRKRHSYPLCQKGFPLPYDLNSRKLLYYCGAGLCLECTPRYPTVVYTGGDPEHTMFVVVKPPVTLEKSDCQFAGSDVSTSESHTRANSNKSLHNCSVEMLPAIFRVQ